jgi:hypothetical protein
VEYEERLAVPLRWWLLGTMLVTSLGLAVLVALPPAAAGIVTGLAALGMAMALVTYGGARVRINDGELWAGRAHIDVRLLGPATQLDPTATRKLAGVDADARAYLLLRPYLQRAVRVDLHDPADPTPYWLVSSRRPDDLVAALQHVAGRLTAPMIPQED